jgi:hypothetical protein
MKMSEAGEWEDGSGKWEDGSGKLVVLFGVSIEIQM